MCITFSLFYWCRIILGLRLRFWIVLDFYRDLWQCQSWVSSRLRRMSSRLRRRLTSCHEQHAWWSLASPTRTVVSISLEMQHSAALYEVVLHSVRFNNIVWHYVWHYDILWHCLIMWHSGCEFPNHCVIQWLNHPIWLPFLTVPYILAHITLHFNTVLALGYLHNLTFP